MNKHKLDYEAPEASTFVVRFEGCLCVSDQTNQTNSRTGGEYFLLGGGDDSYDEL